MKNLVSLFALLSLVAVMVVACGAVGKTTKPSSEAGSPATARSQSEKPEEGKLQKLPPLEAKQKPSSPADTPDRARSGLPDKGLASPQEDGMTLRADVNQAALEFAKNFPDVIAVKTIYSKLYGGWNLDLFVGKGKKIDKQQFSWNNKTKEWEPTARLRVEHPENLQFLLDTNLPDEKGFVLKR
jgi:predicted small lipoprotein YifL